MDNTPTSKTLNSPLWALAFIVLPQAILFALFLSGYSIIYGEMGKTEQLYAAMILLFPVLNIVLISITAPILKCKQKKFSWWFLIIMAVAEGLFLWASVIYLEKTIPDSVNRFIFPQNRYFGFLFAFYMPPLYYSFQNISTMLINKSVQKSLTLSLSSIFGLPLLLYIGVNLSSNLFRFDSSATLSKIGTFLGVFTIIMFAALFILALINLLNLILRKIKNDSQLFRYGSAFVVGVVLPFAGLCLNRRIPFPTDFQHWQIYTLAILNGVLLAVPQSKNKTVLVITFGLKAFFYPFTIYFFLVFLPYLPLSIFAIIAVGAGFLMLTPLALFYIHTQILVSEAAALSSWINTKKLIILSIVAVLGMPALITLNAVSDKAALFKAIEYVYNPNYTEPADLHNDLPRIRRALQELYDLKEGIEMPYISQYYRWIVFDNLVLSDSRIENIYFQLFGKKIDRTPGETFNPWGESGRRRWRNELNGLTRHDSERIIISDQTSNVNSSKDGVSTTTLSIELKNNDGRSSIGYASTLTIPEGVFITGFTLKIGDEIVPGKIFEKKSALWIYEKITDERKDPALLYYTSPTTVRLHVFPFAKDEVRSISLTVTYADELRPSISISNYGDIALPIAKKPLNIPELLTPEELSRKDPAKRSPVLHLIVQHSSKPHNWKQLIAPLKKLEISRCVISPANIKSAAKKPLSSLNEDELQRSLDSTSLPPADGFIIENILKKEMISWSNVQNEFPVFVIISHDQSIELTGLNDFNDFTQLIPENSTILLLNEKGQLSEFDLETKEKQRFTTLTYKKAVRLGNSVVGIKSPVTTGTPVHQHYAEAFKLKQLCAQLNYNPSRELELFPKIIGKSKQSGIMTPLSSYIVLETQAQWAMLSKTEKKKLKNLSVLDIEEVKASEPPFIIMIMLIGLAMGFHTIIQKRKTT